MTNEELKERFKELMAYNRSLSEITTLFEQVLASAYICPSSFFYF